jgi:hypothetical protein
VVKLVVDLPKTALFVYSDNLNELPPLCLKLCVPSKSSFLKELHITLVVIAIITP